MSGSVPIIGIRESSPHEKGPGFLVVGSRKFADPSDGLSFIDYFVDEQRAVECLKESKISEQWNVCFIIPARKGVWF